MSVKNTKPTQGESGTLVSRRFAGRVALTVPETTHEWLNGGFIKLVYPLSTTMPECVTCSTRPQMLRLPLMHDMRICCTRAAAELVGGDVFGAFAMWLLWDKPSRLINRIINNQNWRICRKNRHFMAVAKHDRTAAPGCSLPVNR